MLGSGKMRQLAVVTQSDAPAVSSDGSVLFYSATGDPESLASLSVLHIASGRVNSMANFRSLGAMALDPSTGDLIAANHTSRTVVRVRLHFPDPLDSLVAVPIPTPTGSLVATRGLGGRPLKRPSGITVRSDGLVYFTDSVGLTDQHGPNGRAPRPSTPDSDGPADAPLPNAIYSTRGTFGTGGRDDSSIIIISGGGGGGGEQPCARGGTHAHT